MSNDIMLTYIPWYEVTEAPVVLLTIEQMLNSWNDNIK